MILITTPGFRLFDALNRQTASQSRANGDGHNCVPNKDRADFPPVLESGHTIAVVQAASRAQVRALSHRCGEKSDRECEQHEATECVYRCVYRIGHWKITRNPVV